MLLPNKTTHFIHYKTMKPMPKHQRPLTLICNQFICKLLIFLYFYERHILNWGKYPCLLNSVYNSIKKAWKIDIWIVRPFIYTQKHSCFQSAFYENENNAHSRVSHEVNWSLWHAIVNNSLNWFRRVGVHTLYESLLEFYALSVSFLLPFIHLNLF